MEKAVEAFRTISEVAEELDVPKHVLRFWEGKFPQVKPMKRGGGRRYYRPDDVVLLKGIRRLLYDEGYTIKGVQKVIRDSGSEFVKTTGADAGPGVGGSGAIERPVVAAEPKPEGAPVPEMAARATPRARGRLAATVAVVAPPAVAEKPARLLRRAPAVAEIVQPGAAPRALLEEAAPALSVEQTRRLRQARRELEICLHLLANDDDDGHSVND
jgi:DNA-binding transcriptional MerR regulator